MITFLAVRVREVTQMRSLSKGGKGTPFNSLIFSLLYNPAGQRLDALQVWVWPKYWSLVWINRV